MDVGQPVLEQPVHRLLAQAETAGPRWIIALAGVPGSGKTTRASQLADTVNHRTKPGTVAVLSMDGFHLPKAALQRFPNPAAAFARRGAPWTFDTAALEQRLRQLRTSAGQADVSWPGFEHTVGDPLEDAHRVPGSTRLIIVEGLYLLHQADGWEAISRLFDERWYLDVSLDLALDRLAARHMQAWGVTRAVAEQRISTNDRLNAELVLASARFADWWLIG